MVNGVEQNEDIVSITALGTVEILVKRWWSGTADGEIVDPIPLPDLAMTLEVTPSRNDILAPLSVTLTAEDGAARDLAAADPGLPHFSFLGGTWLQPVSVDFGHADPAASLAVDRTYEAGSGPITTSYHGEPIAPAWGAHQHLDVLVLGLDADASARVDLTVVDPEDWREAVVDTVQITDPVAAVTTGAFNSATYDGASDTPSAATGAAWESYRIEPAASTPWAAQGFALRVDGVPAAIGTYVDADADSVELVACFNALADCTALDLDPSGSAVVATYALPPQPAR